MSNCDGINVYFESFRDFSVYPLANMLNKFQSDNLQEISEVDLFSTVIGPRVFYNFYESFRTMVHGYIGYILRDLCSVADMAASFVLYDHQCFDGDISNYVFYDFFERSEFSSAPLSYSVDTNVSFENDWIFCKSNMDDEIAVILRNLLEFMVFLPQLKEAIKHFSRSPNFTGLAAEAAKNYFATIHLFGCDALYVCAQTAFLWISQYWVPYRQLSCFQAGVGGACTLIKPDIVLLRNSLQEKKEALEEKYPQISTQNTTLASATNNAYDYSVNLTCLYSLPDYIGDAITSCNDIIGFVEGFEPLVISSIMPEIDSVMQEFCSYASQLARLMRENFISPPPDINAEYLLDEYEARLREIQTRNEFQMTGVLNAGLEETKEVNKEFALEAEERRRGLTIAGDALTIIGAILSIVLTEGATIPYIFAVIGDAASITSSGIDIYNQAYEIQIIQSGEMVPENTNYVRDALFEFVDDRDTRDGLYKFFRITGNLIQISGSVAKGGLDGNTFDLDGAFLALGSETASVVLSNGEDGDDVVEFVMVPVDLASNGEMPGLSDICEGLSASFGAASEIGGDYSYDDWISDYNSASSQGVIGGGGFIGATGAQN